MRGRDALRSAAGQLEAIGYGNARWIATQLMKNAVGLDGFAFHEVMEKDIFLCNLDRFWNLTGKVLSGEPVQYVLGEWDFCRHTFKTDKRALIPRPETELLAEAALAAMPRGAALSVIDAGCGTGCIGITIKLERPEASVTLCDVSPGALSLARENAGALGADVLAVEADMRRPLPGGPYDIIVSNPPYISAADMECLPANVREYEPELALCGGEDGLDFVRALAGRAVDSLKPGGWLFVEIGYGQADRAADLLAPAGMSFAVRPDYAGIPRVVAARKDT